MEKINSKLNINLNENGCMYLTVYGVRGKKTSDSYLVNLGYFSTDETAEKTAKFWRETMNYEVVFTMEELVFIQ